MPGAGRLSAGWLWCLTHDKEEEEERGERGKREGEHTMKFKLNSEYC